MLLASFSHTRAQQAAIGTLLILTMSAIGGSMFPRFPHARDYEEGGAAGLSTPGPSTVTPRSFWRDEPVSHLLPQVAVLLGFGVLLFLIARRFARRWESVLS